MEGSDEVFTFTWKIEDYSMLPHQEGEKLVSPSFTVDFLKKTKWCLWLYPRADAREASKGYISCYVVRMDSETSLSDIKVDYFLTLEPYEKPPKFITYVFNNNNQGVGYMKFHLISEIFENKELYLPRGVLTVSCRLKMYTEEPEKTKVYTNVIETASHRNQCSSTTRMKVHKKTLTWPIKKIYCCKESREEISLNTESALEGVPSLKLSICFNDPTQNEFAQIKIIQTATPEQRLFVKCKMAVLGAAEEYQDAHEDTHLFSLELDEIWCFPVFIKKANLVDDKYIYADNTLLLQCELAFSSMGTEYHLEVPQHTDLPLQKKTASNTSLFMGNIQELYSSGKFCDVTLSAGGKTFPSHKLVLCARSPVFCAMFENDMKEKNTGIVDITDVDPNTLQRMLTFLHSDVIEEDILIEDILKLYAAADKYQIVQLKRKCSLLLISNMSVDSVFDILVLVDRHQDAFLSKQVSNFMAGHMHQILNSPQWDTYFDQYPKLLGGIVIKFMKKDTCF